MQDRQLLRPACKCVQMMVALLATALFTRSASAQVEVELVLSVPEPEAPLTLTITASTPPDEPILAYEWRGLQVSPRCRSRDCTIDVPVASCRRVEVSVTDRFGLITTVEDHVCANEGGARPPRATIDVQQGDPVTVSARADAGDAKITVTRLWVDAEEQLGEIAELPKDGECHVVDLLVADREGRIGVDHRLVCSDPDAPRIAVGAEPSFCPRPDEALNACAEVIDPLGQGITAIEGEPIPLDGCAELTAGRRVDRIVVRGETAEGTTHGSMITCTAPATGRPNLLFAHLPDLVSVVRGERRSASLSIDGGEPPFTVSGELLGTREHPIDLSGIDDRSVSVELDVPRSGTWHRLELTVIDGRGLEAVATASVATEEPPLTMPGAQGADVSFNCSSVPLEGAGSWIVVLLGAIRFLRRRS